MKIDVVLSPPEIDLLPQKDLSGSTMVVFDVLRATSSMITALAHGTAEIYPVCTIEEALALKTAMPDALLGGERNGDRIEGFEVGNSPAEYLAPGKCSKRIITTTTNGTVALKACEKARRVYVGALLNMGALVRVLQRDCVADLKIVCAGTFRDLALEDVFAAGMLCDALAEDGAADLTDSAVLAWALYRQHARDALGLLRMARNGRVLQSALREEDVKWCSQVSLFQAVGILHEGAVRPLGLPPLAG